MKNRLFSVRRILKRSFKCTFAALIALGSVVSPVAVSNVYADEDTTQTTKPAVWLQISPVSNRVSLVAGEALQYNMNIDNKGSEAFEFKVYAAPYSIANENYEVNFNKETPRTQIVRWITFNQNLDAKKEEDKNWVSEAKFTLNAGERKTIEYRVSVPSDVPDGGQYATIFAESIPKGETTSTGIKTASRVGLILYGRTNGETKEESKIEQYKIESFLTGNSKIGSSVEVTNNGNTDFSATYSLKVDNFLGGTAYEESKPYDVLPDTTRKISTEWEKTPLFGIFHVTTEVSALDQLFTDTKLVVKIPIFIIIVMLILLTIVVVWLIIIVKKRRAQKSRLIV